MPKCKPLTIRRARHNDNNIVNSRVNKSTKSIYLTEAFVCIYINKGCMVYKEELVYDFVKYYQLFKFPSAVITVHITGEIVVSSD